MIVTDRFKFDWSTRLAVILGQPGRLIDEMLTSQVESEHRVTLTMIFNYDISVMSANSLIFLVPVTSRLCPVLILMFRLYISYVLSTICK